MMPISGFLNYNLSLCLNQALPPSDEGGGFFVLAQKRRRERKMPYDYPSVSLTADSSPDKWSHLLKSISER